MNILAMLFYFAAVSLLLLSVEGRAGYSLSFQEIGTIIATKTAYFNYSDPGFDNFSSNFTICWWMRRFNDDPVDTIATLSVTHPGDENYIQPFRGSDVSFIRGGTYKEWVSEFYKNGYSPTDWNHYCTSSNLENAGETKFYANGKMLETANVDISTAGSTWAVDQLSLFFGAQTYGALLGVPELRTTSQFVGQIDDFAFFNKVLNETEMDWWLTNTPDVTGDLSSEHPNLVLFYNFDLVCSSDAGMSANGLKDTSCTYADGAEAPNYGLAGPKYNMLLGSFDPSVHGFDRWTTSTPSKEEQECGSTEHLWKAPRLSISSAPVKAENPSIAPIVVNGMKNTTVKVALKQGASIVRLPALGTLFQADGVTPISVGQTITDANGLVKYATPATSFDPQHFVFSSTLGLPVGDTIARNQQVHVWESKECLAYDHDVLASEDSELFVKLLLGSACTLGEQARAQIISIPAHGRLYQAIETRNEYLRGDEITAAGTPVSDPSGTVFFLPRENEVGMPYTTFQYKAVGVSTGIESPEKTVTVNVRSLNDYPAAGTAQRDMDEDGEMQVFDLEATDVEGQAITVAITKLPELGKLFSLDNNNQIIEEITSTYEVFQVGEPIEQWVDSVPVASSYWGSPPSVAYHPLMLVGSPTCPGVPGECADLRPSNSSLVGPLRVGDTVFLEPAPGATKVFSKIVKANVAPGQPADLTTYDIQVYPMQKEDAGATVLCTMKGENFPDDCIPIADESELSYMDVPTAMLHPLGPGVWCPKYKGYKGSENLVQSYSDAYGSGFYINHTQTDYYLDEKLNPRYTEFVHVQFKEEVFPVAVEVHSPRGMGAVVHIKAKDPLGNWKTLYSGESRQVDQAKHEALQTYSVWSPTICRPSFKTNLLRLEIDSTATTGIGDWNYIDAVRLYGARNKQSAVLEFPNKKVGYLPHPNANGLDHFEYRTYDCGGDRFRGSLEDGKVSITLLPAEDAPVFTASSLRTIEAERNIDPLDFSLDIQDSDLRDSVELKVLSCNFGELDTVVSSDTGEELCGLNRDPEDYPYRVKIFQVSQDNTTRANFQFTPAGCELPEVFNGSMEVELVDSGDLRSGPVIIRFTNDCTNMPWSPIATLPITLGVLGATCIAVVSLALSLRRESSFIVAILDFIFSPMFVALVSMSFEGADLVTDIVNALKFVYTEDRSLKVYTTSYVALTSVACLVSIWAIHLRARNIKTLISLETTVNADFPKQRRLSSLRNSVDAPTASGKFAPLKDVDKRSRDETRKDLLHAVDHTTHLLAHDLRYLNAKMDHIKVSAILLMCEDIPMIILNLVVIFSHKRMLTDNVFLISFILNLILITVKLVSVAEFRNVKLERSRNTEVLNAMQDNAASEREKMAVLLTHSSRNTSVVAKKMMKMKSSNRVSPS